METFVQFNIETVRTHGGPRFLDQSNPNCFFEVGYQFVCEQVFVFLFQWWQKLCDAAVDKKYKIINERPQESQVVLVS